MITRPDIVKSHLAELKAAKIAVMNLETEIERKNTEYMEQLNLVNNEKEEALNSAGFGENAFLLLEVLDVQSNVQESKRVKFDFKLGDEIQVTDYIDVTNELVTFDIKLCLFNKRRSAKLRNAILIRNCRRRVEHRRSSNRLEKSSETKQETRKYRTRNYERKG